MAVHRGTDRPLASRGLIVSLLLSIVTVCLSANTAIARAPFTYRRLAARPAPTVQFDTAFAQKASAVETVIAMRDTDREWHVGGYFIR